MQEVRTMTDKPHNYHQPSTINNKQKGRRGKIATLFVSLGAFGILFPLIIVCATVVFFEVNQWNLPGVSVYDRSVALMSPDETEGLIDKTWNKDRQIHLLISEDPGEGFWLAPAELGYWVDPEATAQKAWNIGRSAAPFADIQAVLGGEQQVIQPVIYFDEALARQTLETISQTLDIAPENASVVYQKGTWVALPGIAGQRVDVEATLEGLFQNAFTNLVTESALLVVEDVQPEIVDVTPLLDEIKVIVSKDLILHAYDPVLDESLTWSVPVEVKRDWVAVDPESNEVGLSIPKKDIQTLIQNWESDLGDGRTFANLPENSDIREAWAEGGLIRGTIVHKATTYQVSGGESLWSISLKLGMPMWHIIDANPGLTTGNISAGMTLTIPSKNVLLPLPPVENKRIVIDISDQRMTVYENGQLRNTHLVSTGVSDSPTMAGIFQIQTHEINAYASNWDLYMPHFMGIYEAWPGFMNGIHGLPLLSNGQRLWASSLGAPASYGCIILNLAAAEELYHWADPGVVVEIKR